MRRRAQVSHEPAHDGCAVCMGEVDQMDLGCAKQSGTVADAREVDRWRLSRRKADEQHHWSLIFSFRNQQIGSPRWCAAVDELLNARVIKSA